MAHPLLDLLRDQGRGVIGALLLGTPFLFTMETWWLGWRLPAEYLVAYTVAGLTLIVVIVRQVGFKKKERNRLPSARELVEDVAELAMQSFVASYTILLLFGVVQFTDSLNSIVRLGLMQLVPLGLGAAIANHMLESADQSDAEAPFPKDVAIFALGGLFFSIPIAPTEEMELMATRAGWARLAMVVAVTLITTHLALYEIELRGQKGRLKSMSHLAQWGATALAYGIAFVVSFLLLLAFGHFTGQPPAVWVALTIVLAFPAALGGSAARVVL